ncbi:MAG: PilZ domain-containing protein [Nitrospira sp.]|nr:PilZ domain-containing protein [Nitrospira sp.]MDH4302662.1 PilZ domain-containing protein [Nitrospira sp.]MDH5192731.1 PilZ domain-containing protein [Nitrospira sp.]
MQTIQQPSATVSKPRRYPRVRILTPFSCSLSSLRAGRWFRKSVHDVGLVHDLSTGGVCVSTDAPIEPGDQVSLTLRLTKSAPPAEVAVATVCWRNHQFHGLAFRMVSESASQQLVAYMNATAREEE